MDTLFRLVKRASSPQKLFFFLVLLLVGFHPAWAAGQVQTRGTRPESSQSQPAQRPPEQAQKPPDDGETKITPDEAKELFRSVDEILNFVSKDSHLAIKHPVERALADREQVRKFVLTHLQEDKDAQRLQRSEASMKKFGLLPQDFDLRQFLLDILEDQVAGYYDVKTKTVYLLDWVALEAQRPVLAHELTHALQDQNFGLDQWMKVRPDDTPEDPDHLDTGADEEQAARQAVSEGQGMAVMLDYTLQSLGINLEEHPEIGERMRQSTAERANESPLFANAPMYLREMVIFPYTYGLSFHEDLVTRGGRDKAFAGAFKDPPRDTREIMQPDVYLEGKHVAPLQLPDLSSVLKKNYVGYDSGSVGEFDVYILLKQFSGQDLAERLSTSWAGGVYYLGRRKDAKVAKGAIPQMSDLGLLYVSNWATPEDAGYFAKTYSLWLAKKYKSVKTVQPGRSWETDQGPVSIETAGNRVLVMEGLDPETAAGVRGKVMSAAPSAPARFPTPIRELASPIWAVLDLIH